MSRWCRVDDAYSSTSVAPSNPWHDTKSSDVVDRNEDVATTPLNLTWTASKWRLKHALNGAWTVLEMELQTTLGMALERRLSSAWNGTRNGVWKRRLNGAQKWNFSPRLNGERRRSGTPTRKLAVDPQFCPSTLAFILRVSHPPIVRIWHH